MAEASVPEGLTELACPYCGRTDAEVVFEAAPAVARCPTCRLYRLKPRMGRAGQLVNVEAYYRKADEKHLASRNPLANPERFAAEIRLIRRFCTGRLPPQPTVLDVGCYCGDFVAALNGSGFRAVGIDPTGAAVRMGRRAGLDLHQGRFDEEDLPAAIRGRTFDVISFRQSIYYLPDLKQGFALIRRMLPPGGGLYVQATQARSLYFRNARQYLERFGPFVAGMLTRESLNRILEREGFREVARRNRSNDVLRLLGKDRLADTLTGRLVNRLVLGPIYGAAGRADIIMSVAERG